MYVVITGDLFFVMVSFTSFADAVKFLDHEF